jgi:hypothetical protein
MPQRRQFICEHCGRRVFADRPELLAARLCRSCFEKARRAHKEATPPSKPTPPTNPAGSA